MLKAGTLNQRIRIERKETALDPDYNTQVVTWVEVATVWAEVQDVLPSRSESVQQSVQVAERPSRVRMRYLHGVTSDMRIVILDPVGGNRITEIVGGPATIGRREGLELLVKSFSTQGQ